MSENTKTAEIKFTIQLDEKNIPQSIIWNATDSQGKEDRDCKSMMVNLWDTKDKNTMTINLWTKGMMVDEMHTHFFQSLMIMAESHEKATGAKTVEDMKKFCETFSKTITDKK